MGVREARSEESGRQCDGEVRTETEGQAESEGVGSEQ